MDCSSPHSSYVLGISQARILDWIAIPFSRGSSWPRDWTRVSWISCIAGRFFTVWATREESENGRWLHSGRASFKSSGCFLAHLSGGRHPADANHSRTTEARWLLGHNWLLLAMGWPIIFVYLLIRGMVGSGAGQNQKTAISVDNAFYVAKPTCPRKIRGDTGCEVSIQWDSSVLCLAAQSWPTLCDPMGYSPPGSSVHGDSPGKNTGVCCHALLQGNLPNPGRTQVSHTAGGFFTI